MNLNIKVYFQNIYLSGLPYTVIRYQAVEYYNTPTLQFIVLLSSPQDPNASPNPIFPDVDTAIAYYSDPLQGNVPNTLVDNINSNIGSTIFTSYTVLQVDPPVAALFGELSPVAFSGAYADLSGTPDLSGYVVTSTTVNGHNLASNVSVSASDVGLGNVNNTSDVNKPVSTATATALSGKQASLTTGSSSQYLKGDLTLGTTPTLATVATSGSYADLSSKPSIPAAQVNADWNATSGISQITNKPTLATVATSGAYGDLGGKPTLATVATSGSYADLSSKPTIPSVTRTFTYPTRTLNSAFQISSTQDAFVSYSVNVACALSLTGGQQGTVTLKYADDSGFTTNVKTAQPCTFSNTGTLVIGVTLNQLATATLSNIIPAGKYAMLSTSNDTGAPTFTEINAQEILL